MRLRWGEEEDSGREGIARCMGKKRTERDGGMHEEDREWMMRYSERTGKYR